MENLEETKDVGNKQDLGKCDGHSAEQGQRHPSPTERRGAVGNV